MKQLVLFVIMVAALVACGDDEKGGGRLDPNAMISLRAAKGVKAEVSGTRAQYLTPLEIVTQAGEIVFINKTESPNSEEISRGFSDNQRDFANERLLMWGTDIIAQDGSWHDNFIGGADVVLVRGIPANEQYPYEHRDTIAYIKNATLRAAKVVIKAAYDRGDYAEVYRLFDEAFIFEPITGPEWQALKAKGEN